MAAQIASLPFSHGAFDLVCALDIVEHVDDDDAALSEISRVAEPSGAHGPALGAAARRSLDGIRQFCRPPAPLRAR
jgi:ubiquinone/menaquinone biosynthesis C-methylase UbiE